MNYKQARSYLIKHDVVLMYAPVSGLSISFVGESVKAMIQPHRRVHDTKRAVTELKKHLKTKNTPAPTKVTGEKH
ncbi:MAG: hypothetical protein PHY44_00800 [Lachnospiraceae bacterium]|nr:hypothetical protein [Lachnospiraceae bacterium]